MRWLAAAPAVAAAAYYLLAIVAALRWRAGRRNRLPHLPAEGLAVGQAVSPARGVSILKAVHGRDPRFYEAIRSHARQDYPEFEILFGVGDPGDPALEDLARLQREFPSIHIDIAVVSTQAPNAKVGILAELARRARYPLLLVNDSDIQVEPGYLRAVTAPLADPAVGLVTCLYRARADSWASRCEALGIATEFAPSVLVARLLGQAEFALGSTMAFRAETLRAVGGFEAIAEYLADDYQLGRRISAAGGRIVFAPVVVETDLGAESWRQTWRHQVRWARTIRVSRPGGYFGYAVTHATVWAGVACAAGQWWCAAAALALRLTAGALAGAVLQDRYRAGFWLMPLRDLFGFAVWIAGATGNTVHWRDRNLKLLSNGRIAAPR
ncbi:MAG: bacteriohopanetetrol glucosamine biosynthesis glycosyltransferase HpnI [Bryobacteraceae bacterium]